MLSLRIGTLERHFEQPTSDEREIKLRETLLMYAGGSCFRRTLISFQETQRY